MGFAMMNANFPMQKNTSGHTCLTEKETVILEESPCIGCGRCINACPCGLAPVLMIRSLLAGNNDEAKKYGLLDCVECVCCSYACPAKIKLFPRFRAGKALAPSAIAVQKATEPQQRGY